MFSPKTPIPKRRGVVLNEKLAVEIYMCKPILSRTKGMSVPLSRFYNISPKAVRDIWNHKTWSRATCKLLSENQARKNRIHLVNSCLSPNFNIVSNLQKEENSLLLPLFCNRYFDKLDQKLHRTPAFNESCLENEDVKLAEPANRLCSPHSDHQHSRDIESFHSCQCEVDLEHDKHFGVDDGMIPAKNSILYNDPFHFDWPFW